MINGRRRYIPRESPIRNWHVNEKQPTGSFWMGESHQTISVREIMIWERALYIYIIQAWFFFLNTNGSLSRPYNLSFWGCTFWKHCFQFCFCFCFYFWFLVSKIQKSNIHLSFALFFTSSYFFRVIIHVYSFFNIVRITNNVFILFWSIKRMLYTCSS